MKRSLCFFALLAVVQLRAAGSLMGGIQLAEDGRPIPFLTITLSNTYEKYQSVTNEYGHYTFPKVEPGRYELSMHFNNRTFVIRRIFIHQQEYRELSFDLSNNEQLPQVVAVNDPGPAIIDKTASAHNQNVNYDGPSRNLSSVITMQPGVENVGNKIYIKGSDDVKYFIDGTPMMGSATVRDDW